MNKEGHSNINVVSFNTGIAVSFMNSLRGKAALDREKTFAMLSKEIGQFSLHISEKLDKLYPIEKFYQPTLFEDL